MCDTVNVMYLLMLWVSVCVVGVFMGVFMGVGESDGGNGQSLFLPLFLVFGACRLVYPLDGFFFFDGDFFSFGLGGCSVDGRFDGSHTKSLGGPLDRGGGVGERDGGVQPGGSPGGGGGCVTMASSSIAAEASAEASALGALTRLTRRSNVTLTFNVH
jgi:hypothetical protein